LKVDARDHLFSLPNNRLRLVKAGTDSLLWKKSSRVLERCLLAVGMILVAIATAGMLHRATLSRLALWQFDRAKAAAEDKAHANSGQSAEHRVDFSLWAEKRIRAYKDSLVTKTDPPLGVLQIDKLGIRVPVFDGTDDLTLNRGVGRILGTARLGEPGNIGIAGHRDGFFRGLKDISVGDEVDLMMTTTKATYVVDQIEIVSPADVQVLQTRSVASITLVTCFPFYFVGDAPKRFIVHASLASDPGRKNSLESRNKE
jgi:sortase A